MARKSKVKKNFTFTDQEDARQEIAYGAASEREDSCVEFGEVEDILETTHDSLTTKDEAKEYVQRVTDAEIDVESEIDYIDREIDDITNEIEERQERIEELEEQRDSFHIVRDALTERSIEAERYAEHIAKSCPTCGSPISQKR